MALDVTYAYDSAPAVCAAGETFAVGRLASITRHGASALLLKSCARQFLPRGAIGK